MLRPARREEIELRTLDDLTLVGELALPEQREPVATLVTLHPLPTAGGFMDSHILRKAAARLPALADLAVLDRDYFSVPEEEIKDIQVDITVVGGKVAYRR